MSSEQQTLDGETPPRNHLKSSPVRRDEGGKPVEMPRNSRREWYCSECGARVTLAPGAEDDDDGDDKGDEYGHRAKCSHRIAWRKERGIQ